LLEDKRENSELQPLGDLAFDAGHWGDLVFVRWKDLAALTKSRAVGRYVPSRSLVCCEWFSLALAHHRGSSAIDTRDFLGGVYISSLEFDRFYRYWKDWDLFEELASTECGVSGARLSYWLPAQEPKKSSGKPSSSPFGWKTRSSQLEKVYEAARALTAVADGESGEEAPVLFPEHVLLAIANDVESDIGVKLLRSTLDLERLQEGARKLTRLSR
jgi:hypothetical protein